MLEYLDDDDIGELALGQYKTGGPVEAFYAGMLLPRSQLDTAWKLTSILSASSVCVIFRDFLNETIFLPTCFILNIILPSL